MFRAIHEDALSARVTSLINLKAGDFVVALQPSLSRGKVVLAQGSTILSSTIAQHANIDLYNSYYYVYKDGCQGCKAQMDTVHGQAWHAFEYQPSGVRPIW